jgi:dihydroxy-acid dehydratase
VDGRDVVGMAQTSTSRTDGGQFQRDDLDGMTTRLFMRATGRGDAELRRRPVIGVLSSWSEMNPCNLGLRELAERVKEGVTAAGGTAYEMPTISIAEPYVRPTSLYLRNLMAMDVEEVIATAPIDGVVLLGGCDKTVPAQLMGAISAGKPAVMCVAGPRPVGRFRGEDVGIDDLWRLEQDHRAGRLDDDGWRELEGCLNPDIGTCNVMGTATTVAAMAEVLGFALPGSSLHPAVSPERGAVGVATGAAAVRITREGLTPTALVDRASVENAVVTIAALDGSTNALLHVLAIAGRAGVALDLSRAGELCAATPVVAGVKPVGEHSLAELQAAGGIPAVIATLGDRFDRSRRTVGGGTWNDHLPDDLTTGGVVRSADEPLSTASGLTVLGGSLAPGGALIKAHACDQRLLRHRGPAIVFDGVADMLRRIDDPDLGATADSVLILRGVGPRGGPGMPEVGKIPIPKPLLAQGVEELLRISDGRMSGTSVGAVVLHVSPESAVGGPLALVRDGDLVEIDVDERRLDLLVAEPELARRREAWRAPAPPTRGFARLHHDHVLQADRGCDFDFLVPPSDETWSHGFELALNVSLRFPDIGYADRPPLVAEQGYSRMESWWPFDRLVPTDAERGRFIASIRLAGLDLVLLNTFAGDMAAGDRGLATSPDRHDDFVTNLRATLDLARTLDCPIVHVLLGNRGGRVDDEVEAAVLRNLELAARIAGEFHRRIVIEVLNGADHPDYVLRDLDQGVRWVEDVRSRVGSDAIGLLFDAYHLTMLGEDLTDAWSRAHHVVTHVQVADVPGRGAPGTGTIDWPSFAAAMRGTGYAGIVAFEHR